MRATLATVAALCVCLAFVQVSRADLPIHCLHDQVKGTWVFHKGPAGNTKHIDCSKFDKSQATETIKVTLNDPNTCTSADSGSVGFWTMIYDEGFEVVVDSIKYFAFNKYQPLAAGETNPVGYVTKKMESFCDGTMPGWFHNADGTNWGCYVGEQTEGLGHKAMEPINLDNDDEAETNGSDDSSDDDDSDDDDSNNKNGNGPVEPSYLAGSNDDDDVGSGVDDDDSDITLLEEGETTSTTNVIVLPDDDSYVEHLNRHQKSWTAVVYPSLLSEKIKSYPHRPLKDGTHSRAVTDDRPDDIKYAGLPEAWDWRDVEGRNFDSPVRAQGDCGSCYAFAVSSMMESRIRIKSDLKKTPVLSPQDVLSCCEYAQGCDGGYPYLVGKYLEDFGMVEESCFPYTVQAQCANRCPATPLNRWHGTQYHYVGGFYGNCSEVAIMHDVYTNGPVVTALEAPGALQYYNNGVFHHTELEGIRHEKLKFEKTNHAVVIIGWGKDASTGEKYWIIKNTWGPDWGMNGYFHMRRGADDCAVESMSVSVLPVL